MERPYPAKVPWQILKFSYLINRILYMIMRVLNDQQIQQILESASIGRIGFSDKETVYMIPVMYFYDGKYIIGHSREGFSVSTMRQNPQVCFEVDEMSKCAQWNSVTMWGRYEELTDSRERYYAYDRLVRKINKLKVKEALSLAAISAEEEALLPQDEIQSVVYRIRIEKLIGRLEIQ